MHLTGIFAADPHPEPDVTPECAVSENGGCAAKKQGEKHESVLKRRGESCRCEDINPETSEPNS